MEGVYNLQWYDWVRIGTALLTVYVFRKALRRTIDDLAQYKAATKDWAWVVLASLFLVFERSLEAVADDTDWTWGITVQLLVALVALKAVLRPQEPKELNAQL